MIDLTFTDFDRYSFRVEVLLDTLCLTAADIIFFFSPFITPVLAAS